MCVKLFGGSFMARIFVVDDDSDMRNLVKNVLAKDGHEVVLASDAGELLSMDCTSADLILLDVMMPGMDGFELCENIRDEVDCPILFLTAKDMESDMVRGFGLGADDYVSKPFGTLELRARVNAHLRREGRQRRKTLNVSGVKFQLLSREIYVDGEKVNLTKSEYSICELLACNRGQVFSKEHIYENVAGYDGDGDVSSITEHVKNIRSKFRVFGIDPVETVWGIGYKWAQREGRSL